MPAALPERPHMPPPLIVAKLRQGGDTPFDVVPGAEERKALAARLGVTAIRKLRFEGSLVPEGKNGWLLRGQLGATVVQPCSVTLDPVTTRIDTEVTRRFVPIAQLDRHAEGDESEMPEDDDVEALGTEIDVVAIMTEALSLALPAYPRKPDAALEQAVFAPDGAAPLDDDAVKPFAGLAALRDKMRDRDEDGGDER